MKEQQNKLKNILNKINWGIIKQILSIIGAIAIIYWLGFKNAFIVFLIISVFVIYINWDKYKHAVNFVAKEIKRVGVNKKNGKNKRN